MAEGRRGTWKKGELTKTPRGNHAVWLFSCFLDRQSRSMRVAAVSPDVCVRVVDQGAPFSWNFTEMTPLCSPSAGRRRYLGRFAAAVARESALARSPPTWGIWPAAGSRWRAPPPPRGTAAAPARRWRRAASRPWWRRSWTATSLAARSATSGSRLPGQSSHLSVRPSLQSSACQWQVNQSQKSGLTADEQLQVNHVPSARSGIKSHAWNMMHSVSVSRHDCSPDSVLGISPRMEAPERRIK